MRHFLKLFLFVYFVVQPTYAATPIDLANQNFSQLKNTLLPTFAGTDTFKEINKSIDFNQTMHIRVQQQYAGYPVHGGEAIIHIPKANKETHLATLATTDKTNNITMNGLMYRDLKNDLNNAPAFVFDPAHAQKALLYAINDFNNKSGTSPEIKEQTSELLVYLDKNNQAHWAYRVSFYVKNATGLPAIPMYLLDAMDFHIYQQWDDIKTLTDVEAGGFGGNKKIGKFTYDGKQQNFAKLAMQRDDEQKICFLQNADVTVTDFRSEKAASFRCDKPDATHDNMYWNEGEDAIHGGYSPNNDALYAGKVVKEMYRNWYDLPVLSQGNEPMHLEMVTHAIIAGTADNAAWNRIENKMYFGDGEEFFYPLTSVGVAAHEISHGFTDQHSKLEYYGQSGGMNEAFSDMAEQTAQLYSEHKNSWKIGEEVTLKEGTALRYMDEPTKDGRSIDHIKKYNDSINVHHSSGIYNKAFYLLATSEGWDAKKAFAVMIKANQHYWLPTTDFTQGACGVMSAAEDYKYNVDAVSHAFQEVGIDTMQCKLPSSS